MFIFGQMFIMDNGVFFGGEGHNKDGEPEQPLMMSIGLKDKNGKEIYEGDIVTFEVENQDQWTGGKIGEIVWMKENLSFAIRTSKAVARFTDYLGVYKSTMKVIGNIYEDPNLLK